MSNPPPCPKCQRSGMLRVETDTYKKECIHCHACGLFLYKSDIEESLGIIKPENISPPKKRVSFASAIRHAIQHMGTATLEQVIAQTGIEYRRAYMVLYRLHGRGQVTLHDGKYRLAKEMKKAA